MNVCLARYWGGLVSLVAGCSLSGKVVCELVFWSRELPHVLHMHGRLYLVVISLVYEQAGGWLGTGKRGRWGTPVQACVHPTLMRVSRRQS